MTGIYFLLFIFASQKFPQKGILPLQSGDLHFWKNIRRPLNEDIHEFDQIIICLSKSLNDSINVSELKKRFPDEQFPINLLQRLLLQEFGDDHGITATWRAIQEFRSKGVAHRKGSDYHKLFKKLGVADKHSMQSLMTIC